ncbi:MAG TPA: TolC family protein [Anaerovoracaceae bacterium]|nr:TolC family protein [Anaerovoracaceae bacterium]
MNKRIFSILIAILVTLGAGVGVFSVKRAIVPDMNFVGEPISLSLEQAVEIMQTKGSRAETALLNKDADEAVAKGYKESVQSIADFFRKLDKFESDFGGVPLAISAEAEAMGMTESNEKIMKMRRDFAKEQVESNYQAELNEIEAMTIQVYYGILLAEENLKIAKDNLANQKTVYNNTLKKYKVGAVAKVDTMMAETEVLVAEDQLASAESAVKNAKMSFNLLLGYDLMQQVTLTDKLVMAAGPEGNLTGLIESALNKRNEIKGVSLAYEIQKMLLDGLNYRYPKNSSTYLKQEVATLQSKKALEDAPIQIEMDIRGRFIDLADKKRAVDVAKANLKNAKEGYRLATISYNAGVNTFTDVQGSLITSYRAELGVAAAINDYNLGLHEFKHAIDVGTMRLPL